MVVKASTMKHQTAGDLMLFQDSLTMEFHLYKANHEEETYDPYHTFQAEDLDDLIALLIRANLHVEILSR